MTAAASDQVLGGSLALASAAAWAAAAILWMRLGREVSPLGMNLGRCIFALACLGLMFLVTGSPSPKPGAWAVLGASGLVGITIGDTTYFAALVRLGPRRMLVVTTLIPVAASTLAILALGERPDLRWASGAALCIAGVTYVLRERLPAGEGTRGGWRAGVWLGLLTVICEAVGIVLSKVGMRRMGEPVSALDATFVRLLAGTLGLLLVGIPRLAVRNWMAPFRSPHLLGVLFAASFLGTFLGIWLAQGALWYADVTVASVLGATSPLFILPMAVFLLRERVTWRAVLGALVAVAGVAVLMVR